MSRSIRAILVIALLVASACGGDSEEPESDVGGGTGPTDMAAIEEAATDEGTVVIYSVTDPEEFANIGPVFEKRYPSVKIKHIQAPGEDLLQRLLAESDAGRVIADVVELDSFAFYNATSVDLIEPFEPPEAESFPDSLKDPTGLWTATSLGTDVIAWNTDQVSPEEVPQSYDDMTDPKWRGRLLMERDDVQMFADLVGGKFDGSLEEAAEWLEQVAANEPEIHSGHTTTIELLAAGQGAVFLGALGDQVVELKADGAPVEWLQTEGARHLTVAGVVKDAPHPNAAKLFINWYLSKEGQDAVGKEEIPARPDSLADPALLPEGITWFTSFPDAAKNQNEIADVWYTTLGLQQ